MVYNVERDPQGVKKGTLHVFDIEGQALIFTRSLVVLSRFPGRKTLFRGSVPDRAIFFWRKLLM